MPSADIQPVVPAKRGRGRPSKMSKLLEQQAIDRANGIDTPLPELKPILPPGPKRGRGRPPGVKNGEGQKHQKNNLMNNVPPNPLAPKSTTTYPKGPGSTGTGKRGRPPGVKNGQGKNTAIKKARSSEEDGQGEIVEEDGQGEIVEEDDEEDAYGIQSSSPNGQKSAKDAAAMKKGGHPYMPAYISAPMTTHSTVIPPTGAKRGRPPKK
ncbi:AT hook-like [Phaffia rhodozyma]|uniref:AT hook-like n=1 Tax=Phaffia rhodozyma TaxID=264483 RepID=A0A0F7SLB7_PHARH|nr:AT hook-like [Phaffia rhodozyma]